MVVLPAVKKAFLILLLLVLPLQYSWAATAAYCQHDQKHSAHFGHHSHKHTAQNDDLKKQTNLVVDNDCGYCHLSAQAWVSPSLPQVEALHALDPPPEPLVSFTSYFPEGPRRPDRILVA